MCWSSNRSNSNQLSESKPFPPAACCCVASSLDDFHPHLSVMSVICWLSIWAFWIGEQGGKGRGYFGLVWGGFVLSFFVSLFVSLFFLVSIYFHSLCKGKQSSYPRRLLAVLKIFIFILHVWSVLKVKNFSTMHVKSLLVLIGWLEELKWWNTWFTEVQMEIQLQNWGQDSRVSHFQFLPCCVSVCLWKWASHPQNIRISFKSRFFSVLEIMQDLCLFR